MAESGLWFLFDLGPERLCVREEAVWRVEASPRIRPLPRAKTWCAGWALIREHAVPVVGGGLIPELRDPEALLVLQRAGHYLGLPARAVKIARGGCAGEGVEAGPFPTEGRFRSESGEEAAALDDQRLYEELGIVENSGYTTR